MSRKSGNTITNPNSKNGKTIPEMSWDEILALPAGNIPNKKITAFLKKKVSKKIK